jgi:hypothetical protein
MRGKVVGAVVFFTVTGAMYVTCDNSHIDIFPCQVAESRSVQQPWGFERLIERRETTCSLVQARHYSHEPGEYHRLTTAGWITVAAFCGGIGAVAGLLAGLLARRKDKPHLSSATATA